MHMNHDEMKRHQEIIERMKDWKISKEDAERIMNSSKDPKMVDKMRMYLEELAKKHMN